MTDPCEALAEAVRASIKVTDEECGHPDSCGVHRMHDCDCGMDEVYAAQARMEKALAAYDAAKEVRDAEQKIITEAIAQYNADDVFKSMAEACEDLIAARKALEVKP